MGVNSLLKTVTRQRRDCALNPDPSAPESSTLTTRLASVGNESVPKIIINDTLNFFSKLLAVNILLISDRNSFRVLFDKKLL